MESRRLRPPERARLVRRRGNVYVDGCTGGGRRPHNSYVYTDRRGVDRCAWCQNEVRS